MLMKNMERTPDCAPGTPASRKHTDAELLDILRGNEALSSLEAFAKKKYGTVLKGAIENDEMQSKETRAAENFVRPAALSSIAVLRAVAAMRTTEE